MSLRNSAVVAIKSKKESNFFHCEGALSFHFHWGWGWGTYDTLAEISGKVAPGDSLPDPQFATNAGLSLEI